MRTRIDDTIKELLNKKKNYHRWLSLFLVLSILVSTITVAVFTEPSQAFTDPPRTLCCPYAAHEHTAECVDESGALCCSMAVAHAHDGSCYEDGVLICTLPEIPAHTHTDDCYETVLKLICGHEEGEEDHVHSDECYETETVLICTEPELPVHVHTEECFRYGETEDTDGTDTAEYVGDPNVDTESEDVWKSTFEDVEFTGDWAEDVVALAETQIGYKESSENYITEDGGIKGYSRYGAWYGAPYDDWSALFAAFCLHYAGVDEDYLPFDPDCGRWANLLTTHAVFDDRTAQDASEELPCPGDLVFFRTEENVVDRAGIVQTADPEEGTFTAVEGDVDDSVVCRTYEITDGSVAGFVPLPENPDIRQTLTGEYISDDGNNYSVLVSFGKKAGIPEGAELYVSKLMTSEYADYAAQTAEALDCAEEELGHLLLLDITIMLDGEEIRPTGPVSVIIRLEDAVLQDDSQVVHFGDVAEVVNSETVDGEIRFETESFSVYAVVGSVIEQTVLNSDGSTYRVTVTYDETAGIPDGSYLYVAELDSQSEEYGGYVAISEDAAGLVAGSANYLRVFDIKIIDPYGQKVEIQSPVDVRIELIGDVLPESAHIIHIPDGAASGEALMVAGIEGESVSFAAPGFSAYVIVDGPDPMTGPDGWQTVSSIAEFESLAADGLYIGHTGGYYFKNTTVRDSGSNPRVGIGKTKPAMVYPDLSRGAVKYYFEPAATAGQYYIYCYSGDGTNNGTNTRQYVLHTNDGTASNPTKSLSFTGRAAATPFTVSLTSNGFTINDGAWYWNQQGGSSGSRFCAWNSASDVNNYMNFWYFVEIEDDPFDLDGKTFGLMRYTDGLTGIGMMAETENGNALTALPMTVLVRREDGTEDKMFVPDDSGLSMWTFHWVDNDNYEITAEVGGVTKYLSVTPSGAALSDTPVSLKVVPGTGIHDGEICIKSQTGTTLTYNGSVASGFGVGGTATGSEWLYMVTEDVLTEDYLMTYIANQISISDPSITNGSKVLVYTRTWNDTTKRYEYYAVDHDGTLVRVYESGNTIEWVDDRINTLLWSLVEYYWEGTDEPNGYYELYNEYSQKYIAPQLPTSQDPDGQILSDNTIGINLNGRKNGFYYSSIIAWDDPSYQYSGLKVENGRIVPCQKNEAIDFYFATIQDLPEDDSIRSVPTVDNDLFGISMKMVDFSQISESYRPDNTNTTEVQEAVMGNSHFNSNNPFAPVPGLLGTSLDANGYPTATLTGRSLAELFDNAQNDPRDVNHFFIQSIYDGTGYFEFDSTQNSATLIDPATGLPGNDFTVYHELATSDANVRDTLKHGQFLPYNQIEPGNFSVNNPYNLYNMTAQPLPDSDPRKGERLYKVSRPDYYFGMQLEASFVQTPNGKDAWGHDIIFEFSGDDDFWLYVDGELVLDLGGVHSAIPGSVNFCTGTVTYPDSRGRTTTTTLYDVFRSNYESRGLSQAEIDQLLAEKFEDDGAGHMIFRDYTSHDMKIFYMERGAGASNIHLRFNLSSVKEGTVQLSKKLSGVDETESTLAEYPYQIWYRTEDSGGVTYDHLLDNTSLTDPNLIDVKVLYSGSTVPVRYEPSLTIDGVTYDSVYLLKPGETADIVFPDDTIEYWIVECGVDPNIYDAVSANNTALTGIAAGSDSNSQDPGDYTDAGTSGTSGGNRMDFPIGLDSTRNRSHVVYDNHVDDDALRDLTITKKLYDVTGLNEIPYDPAHPVTFSLRLYFKSEFDSDFVPANMYAYHVKDPNGNYCYWMSSTQQFVSLGESDYTNLTDEQKQLATFFTSMNGSISKLPAFYTVEVREILAGTQYMVQERDYEVPDGYSLMKYVLYDQNAVPQGTTSLFQPVSGTMPSDTAERDPHVDVCNVKGFGLRVYKNWADEDYMSYRDPTYFAVFIDDDLTTPLPGTLRQLPYDANPKTLYWYFDVLNSGYTFSNYIVREVELVNPTVDANGFVTSYDNLTALDNHDTILISGTQDGDTGAAPYEYTVHYESELMQDTNVRVYNVANTRYGIEIRKLDWGDNALWGGNGLNNALFRLERVVPGGDDLLVGEFTSHDIFGPNNTVQHGWVTEAYLSEDVDYVLTEVRSPRGHYGLQHPLTLRLHNGVLTVTGDSGETGYHRIVPNGSYSGGTLLEIRNRSYDIRFEKLDRDTRTPLEGVHFALHKEVTVGGVTQMDFYPMRGYEDLVTDSNGIIPLLNNTLVPGNYSLRETQTLPGYRGMDGYLDFSVDSRGNVTVLSTGRENWLDTHMDGDTIVYSFYVPNARDPITLQKVSFDNTDPTNAETALTGATFGIYTNSACTVPYVLNGVTLTGLTDSGDGIFFSGVLPPGDYYVLETIAPSGYQKLPGAICLHVDSDGVPTATKTWVSGNPSQGVGAITYNESTGYRITVRNTAGYELPQTGGSGLIHIYAVGVSLTLTVMILLALRRRRRRRGTE